MEINTIQDIETLFDTEQKANKYLSTIRWGEWPQCPHCTHPKAYFIENGKRYKCTNKLCHKKFSVTTNSLMHGSNLTLTKWIIACFVYSKKIGRCYSWDIQNALGCTASPAWYVKEKLDFAWGYVIRENKSKHEMFEQLIKALFDHGYRLEEFKKVRHATNTWHVSDIDNIADPKQYDRLVRYANNRMFYCEWIFLNFASGEEVISETLIYMAEQGIKEYNADSIVHLINKIVQRMWQMWVDAHPNIATRYRDRHKEWRREWRRNIKPGYVVELFRNNKDYKEVSRGELRSDSTLIKQYRERIKQRRDKLSQIYDWHSHFN